MIRLEKDLVKMRGGIFVFITAAALKTSDMFKPCSCFFPADADASRRESSPPAYLVHLHRPGIGGAPAAIPLRMDIDLVGHVDETPSHGVTAKLGGSMGG